MLILHSVSDGTPSKTYVLHSVSEGTSAIRCNCLSIFPYVECIIIVKVLFSEYYGVDLDMTGISGSPKLYYLVVHSKEFSLKGITPPTFWKYDHSNTLCFIEFRKVPPPKLRF